MNINIHTFLQHLGAADPSKPMVLVNGQPELDNNKKGLINKLFSNSIQIEKDPTVVLKGLKKYMERHLEELDGRDLPALSSIYSYFIALHVTEGAQSETTWLKNLNRSFETLNHPLTLNGQPALASTIPYHMSTGYRIRIAEQTKLIASSMGDNELPMQKGTVIEGGETETSLVQLISKVCEKQQSCKRRRTKISVINRDCLEIAAAYQGKSNVTLLNMANAHGPGGGWLIGDCAQEEELFRRTNYHRALMPEFNPELNKQLSEGRYCIPFYGAIFTPSVTVFRDPENQLFPLSQRFQVNILASAALDLRSYQGNPERQLCGGDKLDHQEIENHTKKKIRAQLATALLHETKILILGAFGCGAFKNPASLVAKCYQEVIEEPPFKYAFREIIFPIIDFNNTNNFAEFSRQFAQSKESS